MAVKVNIQECWNGRLWSGFFHRLWEVIQGGQLSAARQVGLAKQTQQLSRTAKTSRDATQRDPGDLNLSRQGGSHRILSRAKVGIEISRLN